MIRKRIRHILNNYNNKQTIHDYLQEPAVVIKKNTSNDIKHIARPMFNSMNTYEEKTKRNKYIQKYHIYKMKNRKEPIDDLVMISKNEIIDVQ